MSVSKPLLLIAAGGLAFALGGCKVDNRPLLAQLSGEPPPPPPPAYALQQPGPLGVEPAQGPYPLPPPQGAPSLAYPVRYATPEQAYPVAERAYGYDRAFYDAPPDYGFGYGDEEPWVWEAADDSLMFVEPYGDEDRFYYYEPGAPYPYFVRDAGYGYAYGPQGVLIAVFDAAGALLSADAYPRYYTVAERDWSRGYDLRRVYVQAPRYAIDPQRWRARQPQIARWQQTWLAAPERQPAWRQWRASAPQIVQRYAAIRPLPPSAARAHADNGLHLGWERGRHAGWDRHGPPAPMQVARAEARPGAARALARREARAPAPPARFARAAPAYRPMAPAALDRGRPAAWRGPSTTPRGHGAIRPEPPQARFARSAPHAAEMRGPSGPPVRLAEARSQAMAPAHGGAQRAAAAPRPAPSRGGAEPHARGGKAPPHGESSRGR